MKSQVVAAIGWLVLSFGFGPVPISPVNGEDATSPEPLGLTIDVRECVISFPHRRRLASERAGILAHVPDEGEVFQVGAVVARLRDEVPRAALAIAQAKAGDDSEVRAARKALELAAFRRNKIAAANKHRPGTFDSEEVHQIELEVSRAALDHEVAEHAFEINRLAVREAQAELNSYEIRTDRGGVVTRVTKKDGEGVQLGEEVLEIVDQATARVQGYADARLLRRLAPGLKVEVIVLFPDDPPREARYPGVLGFVDVALTSGQEVRLWADVVNRDEALREGMLARFVIAVEADAPATAFMP